MLLIEYKRLAEQERYYWWHLGRLKIIEAHLKTIVPEGKLIKILNVGCGTGGTVKTLEKFGTVKNIDTSETAIKFMKSMGYSTVQKIKPGKLPFAADSFDLVVGFDVLEHIKKDSEALGEWRRVLKPNGEILITVPAHQWLWSGHDKAMHHFRRYSKKSIQDLADTNKLQVVRLSYAFLFSFAPIVLFRGARKLLIRNDKESSFRPMPKAINWLFKMLLYFEANFHDRVNIPVGTSLVVRLNKLS